MIKRFRNSRRLHLNGDDCAKSSPRFAKVAFTLAEVLITLGVIGVVAALTLPTLINEHRILQWETALKRDYTVLSQGFRKMMADYGCDTIECTGVFTTTTDEEGNEVGDHDKLDEAIRLTFDVVKTYKRGEYEDRPFKHLKGTSGSGNTNTQIGNDYFMFVLNDGAMVYMASWDCSLLNSEACAYMYVDTNGISLPNTLGKDVFSFGYLMKDGTILLETSQKWVELTGRDLSYWRNSSGQCGTPNTKLKDETISHIIGQNCLARIMENNWRMDYLH